MKRKNSATKNLLDDLISQAAAAKLRGVTRAAIADLIKRNRIASVEVGGRRLVYRSEIENYKIGAAGRPQKTKK